MNKARYRAYFTHNNYNSSEVQIEHSYVFEDNSFGSQLSFLLQTIIIIDDTSVGGKQSSVGLGSHYSLSLSYSGLWWSAGYANEKRDSKVK